MRIKEVLKEKNLSYQQLADTMGVSLQFIKQTLNAPSVTTSTLEKISSAINVPMWQLFASPEEVAEVTRERTHACPHCGKPISINLS